MTHQGGRLSGVTGLEPTADFHRHLQEARDALLWKLDGLSEYDVRRPLVPTCTNLLGLVKHVAGVELGYFGDAFGRPHHEPLPEFDPNEPNADMWATPDESRAEIVDLYHRSWQLADETIAVSVKVEPIQRVPTDWSDWSAIQAPWSAASWIQSQTRGQRVKLSPQVGYRQQQGQQQQVGTGAAKSWR